MSPQPIQIIFGTGGPYFTEETADTICRILQEHGCDTIDTAQLYEGKGEAIGQSYAARNFLVDTKDIGGLASSMVGGAAATGDMVVQRAVESLKKLGRGKVDTFYLHAPDRSVPFAQSLVGIDKLHKAGEFIHFGLSNFTTSEVASVLAICRENNWILPTVYQGNYNPVSRGIEEDLFPLLRRYGIAFYAYSPLAGGFLTKTKEEILSNTAGRFIENTPGGDMYLTLYNKPTYLEALATWSEIAEDFGIGKAELAYRWVAFNSLLKQEHGDAIVIGARNEEQLRETFEWSRRGPLPKGAVERIDAVWESVKAEAGLDNFNLNA